MKLLFICTHNRCRSILAEAVANHLSQTIGKGRIAAHSAGSQPVGQVHPLSITHLQARGISTAELSSQSWNSFETWKPDAVITVCDSAANELCPVWFGDTVQAHWGLRDPSKLAETNASDDEITAAFQQTITILESRLTQLLSLPFEQFNSQELRKALNQLESINGPV